MQWSAHLATTEVSEKGHPVLRAVQYAISTLLTKNKLNIKKRRIRSLREEKGIYKKKEEEEARWNSCFDETCD